MADFREFIEACGLRDLGYLGNKSTWCNRKEGSHYVSERLDPFLANFGWWNCFPDFEVTHGAVAYFDHSPIWVNLKGDNESHCFKKHFRFEAIWVGEQAYEDIIKDVWDRCSSQSNMEEVATLIQDCGAQLWNWNKHGFGHV